jgi:hypothetical protein
MRTGFYLFFLTFALSHLANAAPIPEEWTSVRALGMGNAYSAIVRDSDAMFYNPAGLARVKGFNFTLFDLRGGTDAMDAVQQYTAYKSAVNTAAFLNGLYGKNYWAGAGTKTALTIPGFGIGAFGSGDGDIFLNNPSDPTMGINYFADYGFMIGGAFDLVPEILSFGLVGRRITRAGTDLPAGPATFATLTTSQLQQNLSDRGTGYGVDLGLLFTMPAPIVKPSLSVVWKNVGVTSFSFDAGNEAPPRILDEIDLGAGLEISAGLLSVTPAFDYKYVNRADIQNTKKIHLGVEVSLTLIDVRVGFNQGYYTAGAGLDLGLFRIDAATYGEELGEYAGQKEDRRYIVQLTMELDFDPAKLGLSGSGEGGRHLKQRR